MALDKLINEMERILKIWPNSSPWKLHQVGMYTHEDVDTIRELYADYKQMEIDLVTKHTRIEKEEGIELLQFCKDKQERGLRSISVKNRELEQKALQKAKGILELIEKSKQNENYHEVVNTYLYLIGEVEKDYPTPLHFVNWYEEVFTYIIKSDGNPKEAVQHILKAVKILYLHKDLDAIKTMYNKYHTDIPTEVATYFKNQIKERLTDQEFAEMFKG